MAPLAQGNGDVIVGSRTSGLRPLTTVECRRQRSPLILVQAVDTAWSNEGDQVSGVNLSIEGVPGILAILFMAGGNELLPEFEFDVSLDNSLDQRARRHREIHQVSSGIQGMQWAGELPANTGGRSNDRHDGGAHIPPCGFGFAKQARSKLERFAYFRQRMSILVDRLGPHQYGIDVGFVPRVDFLDAVAEQRGGNTRGVLVSSNRSVRQAGGTGKEGVINSSHPDAMKHGGYTASFGDLGTNDSSGFVE